MSDEEGITSENHLHMVNSTLEPLSAQNNDYVTFQEVSFSQELHTFETLHDNISTHLSTAENSVELERAYYTQEPARTFLNILASKSENPVTNSFGAHPLSSYNVSAEFSIPYRDELTTGSHFYSSTSIHDVFTNSTFNSSIEKSQVLFTDSFDSNETTFNFELTTWLTLMPPSTQDNGATHAGEAEVDASLVAVKVIILALISLVGSFGNVMVIWSVVKESHLHRPPFYFLLSLGVTDLSRAVFCLPVVITTVLHGSRWRHGESACKLFAFATSFFVFSSALSLLAIAIDRHISIVYSKTYRRRSLGIANLVVAIIIWIIAFSVSFPPVVGIGDYVFIPDEAQCAYQHKHYLHNDSVSSVLVFIAILFLTFFLYFRIFRFLRGHRRMRPLQHTPAMSSNWAFVGPGANGQAFINWLNGFGGQVPVRQGGQRTVQRLNFGRVVNLSTAKNEHLTRLFLVLTIVFGITWSPYVILSLWRIFFDASLIPSSYVTVSAWLGYGQLATSPVVYFLARGPLKKPLRATYAQSEKREFLLENKNNK